jgi:hypothetical protein
MMQSKVISHEYRPHIGHIVKVTTTTMTQQAKITLKATTCRCCNNDVKLHDIMRARRCYAQRLTMMGTQLMPMRADWYTVPQLTVFMLL